MSGYILAWSMTKKKSAVIKNYILDPDKFILENKPVCMPKFINRSEIALQILNPVINSLVLEVNHNQFQEYLRF